MLHMMMRMSNTVHQTKKTYKKYYSTTETWKAIILTNSVEGTQKKGTKLSGAMLWQLNYAITAIKVNTQYVIAVYRLRLKGR